MKRLTSGLTAASAIVVLARSYSLHIGATSCDAEIGIPGNASVQRLSNARLVVRPHIGEKEIQRKRQVSRLAIHAGQPLANRSE